MPYKTGGTSQGNSSRPEVVDVFHSETVFANNVNIALWLEPEASPTIGTPEPILVQLSTEQVESIQTSSAAATSQAEQEVGLAGKGEVPQSGPLEKVTKDTNGATLSSSGPFGTPVNIDPNADPSQIFVLLGKNIDLCLSDAKAGAWKENGANNRIIACYKSQGFNLSSDSTPWCAAFAGAIMKRAGIESLKTLSSLAYRGFGTPVDLNDKSKWRLNDIVVFSRQGGGHIGFFRGYNPSNGSVLIAGGNQSDNLTEVGFKAGGMPIVSVSRAWKVPPEYDKPVTYSGSASGGNIKVV